MGLKDIFVPQWKHSNPKVRREAIKEISDEKILSEIVLEDTDEIVRREALESIKSTQGLKGLLTSGRLPKEFRDKIEQFLRDNAREEILKKAQKEGITDTDLLPLLDGLMESDYMALIQAVSRPIFVKAVMERIKTPKIIFELIQSVQFKDFLDELFDHLEDPHYLRRLSREAQNKRIRKRAQQKLETLLGPAKLPEAKIQQKLNNIIDDLEQYTLSFRPDDYLQFKEKMESEWREFDPEMVHPLFERFQKKRGLLDQKLINYEQQLRNLNEDVEEFLQWNSPLNEDQKAKLKELELRWPHNIQKFTHIPVVATLLERYDRHLTIIKFEERKKEEGVQNHRRLLNELQQIVFQLEKLGKDKLQEINSKLWDELSERWQKSFFHHPDTEQLKEKFQTAQNYLQHKKEELLKREEGIKEQLKSATDILEKFPDLLNSIDIPSAEKQVRQLQTEWKELFQKGLRVEKELWHQFKNYVDEFYKKNQSYWQDREWAMWSASKQKEELIKKLQMALDSNSLEGLGTLIGDLHQTWKDLGPAIREKEQQLWDSFKKMSDEGQQICLKRKQELFQELQNILAPLQTESPQFKELSPIVKRIQEEWNKIGRLPKTLELELQTQFQQLCQSFYDKRQKFFSERDEERGKNLETKRNLLQNIEALLGSSLSNNEKAKQLKVLQQEWKNIGPTPQEEGQILWEQFQTVTQDFFKQFEDEKGKNWELKKEIILKCKEIVNQVISDDDWEHLAPEVKAFQKQWKEIGPIPQEHQPANEEFIQLCNQFFDKRKAHLDIVEEEMTANQQKKEEIVKQIEEISTSTRWKETAEAIKQLQENWRQIGPASPKEESKLWKRLRDASDHFFKERQKYFQEIDKERQDNLRQKQEICRILQVLAHLSITDKELPPIKEEDMAEHLRLALKYKQNIVEDGDPSRARYNAKQEVIKLQDRWKSLGPVPHEYNESIWQEYQQWTSLFFERRVNQEKEN